MITRGVNFTLIELVSQIRIARDARDKMREDLSAIEERIRAGHDGTLNSAGIVLAAEIQIVEDGIRKMLFAYAYPEGTPHTPPP